jgi:hypothetical protein
MKLRDIVTALIFPVTLFLLVLALVVGFSS